MQVTAPNTSVQVSCSTRSQADSTISLLIAWTAFVRGKEPHRLHHLDVDAVLGLGEPLPVSLVYAGLRAYKHNAASRDQVDASLADLQRAQPDHASVLAELQCRLDSLR